LIVLTHASEFGAGMAEVLPLIVVGAIALVLGLVFLIKPRRAGDAWRGLSPYPGRKEVPIKGVVVVGCLLLLLAVAFLSTSAVMLLR